MLVDPGHGGTDSGAVRAGVREKDIALAYALDLGRMARDTGRVVRYTRERDKTVDLHTRSHMVKAKEILISCHTNSVESAAANGASVWYHGGDEESFVLAVAIFRRIMQTRLFKQYGAGVISDLKIYRSGFAMTREAFEIGARAAVLLEPGFISNDRDRAVLTNPSKRIILADAVNDGITDYLASKR